MRRAVLSLPAKRKPEIQQHSKKVTVHAFSPWLNCYKKLEEKNRDLRKINVCCILLLGFVHKEEK